MTSNHTIKKRVAAKFTDILKQKTNKENTQTYTGITMIPYSFYGECNHLGVLSLTKNKNDKKMELFFTAVTSKEPMWKCTLDQFDQLKRPRPNMLSVETFGITTLFKFSDIPQAKALYEAVISKQSTVKVVYQNAFCPQLSFEDLDIITSEQMQKSIGIPLNKGMAGMSSKATKENEKPRKVRKEPKQKSIKNSFKTIINAAARVKDLDKPKSLKKGAKDDDDTSPLLF